MKNNAIFFYPQSVDRVNQLLKKATFFLEKAYRLQKNRYLCSLENVCQPLVCDGVEDSAKD